MRKELIYMDDFILLGNIKGEKGDKGEPGTGLTIKDFYATVEELNNNVPNPSVGDAYGVGEEGAYEIYVYSSTKGWVNSGAFQPDINEQAPIYEEAKNLENLTSTEKISIAFGKIKKAITELILHIGDSSKHLNGTLPVSKGGTGATSASFAANNIQAKSIGSGTTINEKDDLNTYKTVGNYICPMTATALTLSNCPVTSAFNMVVGYGNGTTSYLYQELTHFLTGVKYYRAYTASDKVWNDWKVTYSSAYKPTPSEIGAAPSGRGLGETAPTHNGDFISALKKGGGLYTVVNATDSPTGNTNWLNLIQLTKELTTDGKDGGVQIAADILPANGSQGEAWFRTVFGGTATDWKKIIHSGNIQDYASGDSFKVTCAEKPAGSGIIVADKTFDEILEAVQAGKNVFADYDSVCFQLAAASDYVATFTTISAFQAENNTIVDAYLLQLKIDEDGTVGMGMVPLDTNASVKVTITDEQSDKSLDEIYQAYQEGKFVYAIVTNNNIPCVLGFATETSAKFTSVCVINDEHYGELNVITQVAIKEDGSAEIKETFPVGADGGRFWGNVYAPTPEEGANDDRVATTEFVQTAIQNAIANLTN